jgi:hypothetical protein
MQARHRKAILFAALAGVVALVVFDAGPDRTTKSSVSAPGAPQRQDGGGVASAAKPRAAEKPVALTLPQRSALGEPAGDLFGSQSWQPPPPKVGAAPAKPVAPPVPYRFAGKLMQNGELQIFLSKGDAPIPIKQGEILDGAYRVESITEDRVTLVYVPLGQWTIIPLSSALSAPSVVQSPVGAPSLASQRGPAGGAVPPAPDVASTPSVPFTLPRDSTVAATPETKLPPLLWERPRPVR